MLTDIFNCSLSEVIDEVESITRETVETFGHLTAPQLNWRPDAGQWSIAQCLDHLMVTNRGFFPVFDALGNGSKQTTLWERMPLVPSFFGKLLLKGLGPASKQRFKAPPGTQPAAGDFDTEIIRQFKEQQSGLAARLRQLTKLDATRIIITSPLAKVMTYSLLDACRIIAVHERRHFAQARRVLTMPGFLA